jgi:O-antigen/teichoic acid export membrane protein
MADLWRKIGFTSGARLYSVIAGAVSLIITARALGPSGRGVVAASVTWALLFSTVGCLSLGEVVIHRAAGRDVASWLGSTLAALLFVTAAVTVLGWSTAGLVYAASSGHAYGRIPLHLLLLGFATLPFLVWEQYGSSMLAAVGAINVYNRAEIVGRTVGVTLIAILVGVAGAGPTAALLSLLAAQIIVAGTGLRRLMRQAGATIRLDRALLRRMLVDGLKLHPTLVGGFLFANAAVLIVQSLRGPSQTGPFQVAVQLMSASFLIPWAASLVLYGEIARLGPDRAWRSNLRVILLLVLVAAPLSLLGFLFAPTIVPALFGHRFASSIPVFRVLTFVLIAQTLSMLLAPQWVGRGLFWQSSTMTVALGLCNVGACLILVPAYGIRGAAYSLLGVSVLSLLVNTGVAVWIDRHVKRRGRQMHPHGDPSQSEVQDAIASQLPTTAEF